MAYGDKPPLTPGRLGIILLCLGLLTGFSVWHLFFRAVPAPDAPVNNDLSEIAGETMGTYYIVKAVREPSSPFPSSDAIRTTIERELDNVNEKMSTYRNDSELSRFNQSESTDPFTFSEDTFEVFQLSQRISEQTGGAFDVTVGPLVNAWGFGPEGAVDAPDEATLAAIREYVGFQMLTLDPVRMTVAKGHPDIYVDLSAVAKGYAVDRVADALEVLGVVNYMVEVGGEVRTGGVNAEGMPWRIGIEYPDDSVGGVHTVVVLPGLALATSGDYRNFTERDTEVLSHTIDPRTGRPVPHAVASVSVVHHECAYADALATGLMVMGPDEGLKLAEDIGLPVLFLMHSDGGFEERASNAFSAML